MQDYFEWGSGLSLCGRIWAFKGIGGTKGETPSVPFMRQHVAGLCVAFRMCHVLRYHRHMPSWNIHIAHVERLLGECSPDDLGIADANAFLFGNLVPDICVGVMVHDTAMRIDYRITHMTPGHTIPLPNAERFWDAYLVRRRVTEGASISLLLGAWAHLVTDHVYNERFRDYCIERGIEISDALRTRKQADFDLFGRSLPIESHVQITPELLQAAHDFPPYRVLEEDVRRAVEVADAIVDSNTRPQGAENRYQELSEAWLQDVFNACNDLLATWLSAWRQLEEVGKSAGAADIKETL